MKANLLTDGRYVTMEFPPFPVEVECVLSPSGNVSCTPAQLIAAGVKHVPTVFCNREWYWTIPSEAVIIEDSNDESDSGT